MVVLHCLPFSIVFHYRMRVNLSLHPGKLRGVTLPKIDKSVVNLFFKSQVIYSCQVAESPGVMIDALSHATFEYRHHLSFGMHVMLLHNAIMPSFNTA